MCKVAWKIGADWFFESPVVAEPGLPDEYDYDKTNQGAGKNSMDAVVVTKQYGKTQIEGCFGKRCPYIFE